MYDYHVVRFVPHHKIHSSRLRGTCIARIILFQQFLSFLLWSFFPSYIHFSLLEGRLPSYNVSNTRILDITIMRQPRLAAPTMRQPKLAPPTKIKNVDFHA